MNETTLPKDLKELEVLMGQMADEMNHPEKEVKKLEEKV